MSDRIKDAFDSVHADAALKLRTMDYLADRRAKRRMPAGRLAAACLLLLVIGLGGWGLYETPVSAISIDVNPSIELGVNRLGRVVAVRDVNEDGAALAASVNLKNLPYEEALEALMASAPMTAYLQDGALVSITVIGQSDAESEDMRRRIAACGYAAQPNVECHCGNRAEAEAARDMDLPMGKYRALLALQAVDPSATAEDVRGLTMRQIRDQIAALSGEETTGRGLGHGAGAGGRGGGRHGGQ